ncbi:hypothetical protein ACYATL_06545 [Actinotignum timonense]|uniref:hypothetical protein n=1 Tax=Actinotignum TaxID=1653174 RepID=UPI00254D4FA5|nr:hypothetical protein [Actinotignum timonense]MDK6906643.1 hypothetical protein [Actinotignum timonense]
MIEGRLRAERLQALLDINQATQQELSDLLGVNQPYISMVLWKEDVLSEELVVWAAYDPY